MRSYDELKELIESKRDMQYNVSLEKKLLLVNTIKHMSNEAVIDLVRTGISELGHRLAGTYDGTSSTDPNSPLIDLSVKGMQDCVEMLRVSLRED